MIVQTWVHPRVCGEASALPLMSVSGAGPSPRVRGSRIRRAPQRKPTRSIPACAGKPHQHDLALWQVRVHPRVCGEAPTGGCADTRRWGPSPRVRGSHARSDARHDPPRSIPACAGKPHPAASCRRMSGVHPRVCGEAARKTALWPDATGPSPRVRGSLREVGVDGGWTGSIPACAGKPPPRRWWKGRSWVHPRVCGEALYIGEWGLTDEGPSPRVRGSHGTERTGSRSAGSIPACAGKPAGWSSSAARPRVHPRVCGEALSQIGLMVSS